MIDSVATLSIQLRLDLEEPYLSSSWLILIPPVGRTWAFAGGKIQVNRTWWKPLGRNKVRPVRHDHCWYVLRPVDLAATISIKEGRYRHVARYKPCWYVITRPANITLVASSSKDARGSVQPINCLQYLAECVERRTTCPRAQRTSFSCIYMRSNSLSRLLRFLSSSATESNSRESFPITSSKIIQDQQPTKSKWAHVDHAPAAKAAVTAGAVAQHAL